MNDKNSRPSHKLETFTKAAVRAAGAVAGIVSIALAARAASTVGRAAVNGIKASRQRNETKKRAYLIKEVDLGLREEKALSDQATQATQRRAASLLGPLAARR